MSNDINIADARVNYVGVDCWKSREEQMLQTGHGNLIFVLFEMLNLLFWCDGICLILPRVSAARSMSSFSRSVSEGQKRLELID